MDGNCYANHGSPLMPFDFVCFIHSFIASCYWLSSGFQQRKEGMNKIFAGKGNNLISLHCECEKMQFCCNISINSHVSCSFLPKISLRRANTHQTVVWAGKNYNPWSSVLDFSLFAFDIKCNKHKKREKNRFLFAVE